LPSTNRWISTLTALQSFIQGFEGKVAFVVEERRAS